MELHNLLEDEVIKSIDKFIEEIGDVCSCDKCKLDIAAIALNNLKPAYVVTEKGSLYGRVNNLNYQFSTDVMAEVTKAVAVVGKNPQHEI